MFPKSPQEKLTINLKVILIIIPTWEGHQLVYKLKLEKMQNKLIQTWGHC